eukprot:EG_transcript_4852
MWPTTTPTSGATSVPPSSPSVPASMSPLGGHKVYVPVVGFSPASPATSWQPGHAATAASWSPPQAERPAQPQFSSPPQKEAQTVPPQNGNRTYAGEEIYDFYELLHISRNASQSEIKRAYHHRAMQYHPDKNPDPRAAVTFDRIRKAYDVLKDPDMRSKYDQYGQQGVENYMAHMDRKRQTDQLEREKSAAAAAPPPPPAAPAYTPTVPMFSPNHASRQCANSGAERDRSAPCSTSIPDPPVAARASTMPDWDKCLERVRAEGRRRQEELEKTALWERAKERLESEWLMKEPAKAAERELKAEGPRDFKVEPAHEYKEPVKGDSFGAYSPGPTSGRTANGFCPPSTPSTEAKPQSVDIRITLPVKLEELYAGSTRFVNVDVAVLCQRCLGSGSKLGAPLKKACLACDGRGFIIGPALKAFPDAAALRRPCTLCNGKGHGATEPAFCATCCGKRTKVENRKLTVKIEPGMEPGRTIRLRGQGNTNPVTGETGDVVVTLEQEQHPFFSRFGPDLLLTETVELVDALCGFTLTIRHLDGRALHLKQPPGVVVKPGQVLSVPGEGMPEELHPSRYGSLLIRFEVHFPDQIDEQQMMILRSAFAPRQHSSASFQTQAPRPSLAHLRPSPNGTTLDFNPWHGDTAILTMFR